MHTALPEPKAAKPRTKTKAAGKPKPKGKSAAATRGSDADEDDDDFEEDGSDLEYMGPEGFGLDGLDALDVDLDPDSDLEIVARPSTFLPNYVYTHGVWEHVRQQRVKTKRKIYVAMRDKPDVGPNSFLPKQGLHVCEFTVWQTLNDKPRRSTG